MKRDYRIEYTGYGSGGLGFVKLVPIKLLSAEEAAPSENPAAPDAKETPEPPETPDTGEGSVAEPGEEKEHGGVDERIDNFWSRFNPFGEEEEPYQVVPNPDGTIGNTIEETGRGLDAIDAIPMPRSPFGLLRPFLRPITDSYLKDVGERNRRTLEVEKESGW